jgi:hypothetical protein
VAATFVDDVDEAARWVRANGANGIDGQPWDVSVKAVAHYPTVIYMMADKLDWTTSIGQAYVNQSTDVMLSVQRLRHMAHNLGNLVTTPQQQVLIEEDYISIWPYEAEYIYVPVYDPYICYYRRPVWGFAITFGVGFLIGAWLNRDCDWQHHRVFYHGWRGPGWIERSRPRVHITNIYVDNHYDNVIVNHNINHRNVNVNNIERYQAVHRDVNYNNVRNNNVRLDRRNNVRVDERPGRPPVNNKIINRNVDTGNPRYDQHRGRENPPRPVRPDQSRPTQPQAQPRPPRPVPAPPVARPVPTPQPKPHVFGNREGNFDPRASSQRGQSSRKEMNQPRPNPRPAPPPRAQSKPGPVAHGGERRKP